MGGLVRCDGCGGILWSPLRAGGVPPVCEVCGEPLKPERRRPGRKFVGGPARERRAGLKAPEAGRRSTPEIAPR